MTDRPAEAAFPNSPVDATHVDGDNGDDGSRISVVSVVLVLPRISSDSAAVAKRSRGMMVPSVPLFSLSPLLEQAI